MEKTLYNYTKALNASASKEYIFKTLRSHPSYPSLLSIVDTLRLLNISYDVAWMETKKMHSLAFPYLLLQDESIHLITAESDLSRINQNKQKPNIVLQAEQEPEIKNEDNTNYKRKELLGNIVFGSSILIGICLIFLGSLKSTSFELLLLITAIGGIIISYFIIAKEFGIQYGIIEKFCSSGDTSDCDVVLESSGASLFGIKLSSLILAYFSFQGIILCLIVPYTSNSFSYLGFLSMLGFCTIPFIIYSIFYQYLITETWCKLCLGVIAVLILQISIYTYMNQTIREILNINFQEYLYSTLLFLLSFFSIIISRQKYSNFVAEEELNIRAKRIMYSGAVFWHQLTKEKKIIVNQLEGELIIGNSIAPIEVLMAGSLGCVPCKEAFKSAGKIISKYPEKVCLKIRLSRKNPGNRKCLLKYWDNNISNKKDSSIDTLRLLTDWYDMMDLKSFKNKYITNNENFDEENIGKKLDTWFNQENIKRTPTFFINGYKLPDNYYIDDLLMIIPGLLDYLELRNVSDRIFKKL